MKSDGCIEQHVVVDDEDKIGDNSDGNVYVVLRHAERYDCVWDSAPWSLSTEFQKWPGDPPLSDDGIKHAKEVGESLSSNDEIKDLQHIIVISSPYLRCVQTAAEICRSFNKSSIVIDNQIGEIWHPEVVGHKKEVRPHAQCKKLCKEKGIEIKGDPLGLWPSWPEEQDM